MRLFLLLFPLLAFAANFQDDWLKMVDPVMSSAEKLRYKSMPEEARVIFREHFWDDKAVSAAEFATRAAYVDATFGTSKAGSGANTDQGRVYLSLGAPNRVTNLSSSRSFVPLEIWYYAAAPQIGASSELRLLFYRKNATGLPKLYSPVLDTIRDLLLPQPGTRGAFGPNETADINVMRQRLSARPVENEVLEAAAGVSPGIHDEENDAILLRAMSPERALRSSPLRTQVRSRLIDRIRNLDVIETQSTLSGARIDLRWKGQAAKQIRVELTDRQGTFYRNDLNLNFVASRPLEYLHRFDLLPGDYTLVITADGNAAPYPLHVNATPAVGDLKRVSIGAATNTNRPFEFAGKRLDLADDGGSVAVAAPAGGLVSWVMRDGLRAVWKQESVSDGLAIVRLPSLEPSSSKRYVLEASIIGESRSLVINAHSDGASQERKVISFNANLDDAARWNFLGKQWTRRQMPGEARKAFETSLTLAAVNPDALVGLARLEASSGHVDDARNRVKQALAQEPGNFDALATMAYLEAQLQDYPVAADYFRKALTAQDTPALRRELTALPQ